MEPPLVYLHGLSKQTAEKRYQHSTDEGHTTASHELLHTLGLSTGVIVAVTFQKVDRTPDTETCTQGNDEGLENCNSLDKKFHNVCLPELDHVIRIISLA